MLVDENGVARPIAAYISQVEQGTRIDISVAPRSGEAMSVVRAAYIADSAISLEQERSTLEDGMHEELVSLSEDLSAATSTLKWMFSSRDRKEAAESAYTELEGFFAGDLAMRMQGTIAKIYNLPQTSDGKAWTWFVTDEKRCTAAVESAVPDVLGKDDWPVSSYDAKGLSASLGQLIARLEGRATRSEALEAYAKSSIDKYMGDSLFRMLSDIPVDELKRAKKGIRIKALKDSGFKTIADVCAASTGQLEDVKGIGWSGALDAKGEAKRIAEEAQAGLKLKLSADDKSSRASNVVCAGYCLMRWNELDREREALLVSIRNKGQALLAGFVPACKDLAWLFAPDEEKESAGKAYAELSSYLNGAEAKQARAVLEAFDNLEYRRAPFSEAWKAFDADSVSIINALEEVAPDVFAADGLFGLPEDLARQIQDECFFPDGLLCTLRRYQEMGVKYILHQERTLLGDEMGLGKTVQAIAAMVSLKNTGETHFIVICPASVLENWCREVKKHSRLGVTRIHGANKLQSFESWKSNGGVAVTTYETTGNLKIGEGFEYGLAVVDEAHYIKNPEAARSKNTLHMMHGARRVVFMTGTALENKVDEMLTLIGYLRPDIEQDARPLAFMAGAPQFRDEIAPVYCRRKREDVLSELPTLIESEEWCTLGPLEEEVYERTVLSRSFMAARRVSWNVDDLKDSSKARRLTEIIDDASDDGRKILAFTFFLETARQLVELLGPRCVGLINGSVPPGKRQQIVEEFNSSRPGSVLVAQIQSAGTGMNIQTASVVIICEPQYKPSTENQAVSRAYRMGQTRNVLVYRLLCKDTVDERIYDLIKKKQAIFDAFADKSSAAAAAAKEDVAVNEGTMGKIIEEEIERIKAKNPDLARKVALEMQERATGADTEITSLRSERVDTSRASQACEPKEFRCPRCGREYPVGSHYCGNCGFLVG